MQKTEINQKFSQQKYIDPEFKALEELCLKDQIPIIDRDAADFLKLQLKIKQPKRVLEIGTAYGFSTLLIAKNTPQNCRITSLEIDTFRAECAKKEIEKTAYAAKINIKTGDALDILMYLKQNFDFIFLDAAKGQYLYLFEYIMEILAPAGILLADNVLYKGKVLKDKKARAKIRTIVNNLKKYLTIVMNHPELDSTIITAGDGIAISRRKDNNGKSRTAGPGR
ncbi:O-methyltransferase [Halanaerobium hydrogeniformans]|uniref:tRNA 5-hydroxyuridine methyltransferase n=1 Tax=Halanaerobium hydrogeniformans TaxID=656519 RepID=E4RLG9_HALHG|nr:O-methyltransferase [Halanaerobium hydrogeniformans]ADQ14883.1 O-methyltransferase family 3 [Halanaerobium hydrogeniformans]